MKSEYDFFMRCSKKSHKVEPLLLTKTIMLKTTFWRCDYDKGLLKVKVQQGNLVSKQTLHSERVCMKNMIWVFLREPCLQGLALAYSSHLEWVLGLWRVGTLESYSPRSFSSFWSFERSFFIFFTLSFF